MRRTLLVAALLGTICAGDKAAALSDQRDLPVMFQALNDLMQFAAEGRTVNWNNPQTGNFGMITARARSDQGGQPCWRFERSFNDPAGEKLVEGTACEKLPGLWEIVQEGQARLVEPKPAAATSQAAAKPQAANYDAFMVRESQKLLTGLGYKPGPVDGDFGPKTRTAIEGFERDRGFPVTGIPSPALIALLREAESGAQSEAKTATAAVQPSQPQGQVETSSQAPAKPPASASQTEPSQATPLLLAEPTEPVFEPVPATADSSAGGTLSGLPSPPPPPAN